MKTCQLFFMTCIALLSCREDNIDALKPVSTFDIDGLPEGDVNVSVYSQFSIINNSINATSYLWDFGNGATSRQKNAVLFYPESGTYTLTLTAMNSGMKSVSTRKVNVYDFVVKSVSIKKLNLNVWRDGGNGFPEDSLPLFDKVTIWVEIKKAEPDNNYEMLHDVNAPVIYKSPIVSQIEADSPAPISFYVSEKIILDIPELTHHFGYDKPVGYAFNLYAQDNTGTYLVSSNLWSGSGTTLRGSIETNNFVFTSYGLGGGEIEVQGIFELP